MHVPVALLCLLALAATVSAQYTLEATAATNSLTTPINWCALRVCLSFLFISVVGFCAGGDIQSS